MHFATRGSRVHRLNDWQATLMTEFLKNAIKERESSVARVAVAKVTDS